MTGQADRYRALTTAAVLLVAGIAAVISFVHIESLAVRYGQPLLAAVLLPVSIDGAVAVSSLAMLRAARLSLTAPWLARTMLLLAVGATLACNVAFGLPHGVPGALLSGWPAVAFVGSAEVAISMSRKRAPKPAEPRQPDAPGARQPEGPKPRQPGASDRARKNARARKLLAANPGMPLAEVAEKSGVSVRQASRLKSQMPRAEVPAERPGLAAVGGRMRP